MAKERQKEAGKKNGKGQPKVVENLPQAKEPAPKARDQAAATAKVSGKSVDYASTVLDKGSPELVAAVDASPQDRPETPAVEDQRDDGRRFVRLADKVESEILFDSIGKPDR